jgi:hypothetical protein
LTVRKAHVVNGRSARIQREILAKAMEAQADEQAKMFHF